MHFSDPDPEDRINMFNSFEDAAEAMRERNSFPVDPNAPTIGRRAHIPVSLNEKRAQSITDAVDQWTGEVWTNMDPADVEEWLYNGRNV